MPAVVVMQVRALLNWTMIRQFFATCHHLE